MNIDSIKYILTLMLIVGVGYAFYSKGKEIESLENTITTMSDKKKSADDRVKTEIVVKEKVVTNEVIKYKDKVIYVKDKDTKKEVQANAEKIDTGCTIGTDFIRMHDNIVRARNQDIESSDATGTEPDTKEIGTYSCSEVISVIDENYKRFEENRVLYEATRDAWQKAGD